MPSSKKHYFAIFHPMHLSKTTWIALSGIIWFIVGIGLLSLGFNFILFNGLPEQSILLYILIALSIGFLKGRFVLLKTVRRVVERILKLEPPVRFSQVYSKGYILLIGTMVLLGMSMKYLGLNPQIRGLIDVAIGSALLTGAIGYFRIALAISKETKKDHL